MSDTDRRQQLARERTETAYERTRLAEQRTYSAWIRTGLASVVTGFAIAKLMFDAGPPWLVQTLAVMFVVAGGVMFALAFWGYLRAIRKLPASLTSGASSWLLGLLSLGLFIAAAASLFLVLSGSSGS